MNTTTIVLRVGLVRVTPPVWRRVRVAQQMTLAELHEVLQVVMGWENLLFHEFRA